MDYGLKLLLNLNSTIRGIWHYKCVLGIWEKKKERRNKILQSFLIFFYDKIRDLVKNSPSLFHPDYKEPLDIFRQGKE